MHARTGVGCVGRWVAGALAALGIEGVAIGQTCEPGWTEGFPNAPGFDNEVRAVAFFDSGKGPELYAAGHFKWVGSTFTNGIARWTGSAWEPVAPPWFFGTGLWLGVLDAGDGPALYVTGTFTIPGVSAKNVARWDGRNWSALGAGLNDEVRALTVFDDGTGPAIFAVGAFTASGQTPMRVVAKWNGSSWSAVDGGPTQGYGRSVAVVDLGNGPQLCVGGVFSGVPGINANNIACWDGRQWSDLGQGVFSTFAAVMKMTVFDHGFGPQLTIGGSFSLTPAGSTRPRVARWTGTEWVQVGSDLSEISVHYVNSLTAFEGPGGPTLYIGGVFTGATWLNQVNYVARLVNGDWKTVDGGMAGGSVGGSYVRSLTVVEGAGGLELWAAGAFKTAGDAIANRIARWDGDRWHGLEGGLGLTGPTAGPVASGNCASQFDDGRGEKLFVAGHFLGAGDRVCNSIAAWDGLEWEPLGGGITSISQTQIVPGSVHALHPFDDGSGAALYATGAFTQAGGGPCFNIARWDGRFWSAPGGNGPNGTGRALAVFDDGAGGGPALYVGGSFPAVGPIPAGSLARWNGSAWSAAGGTGVPTATGESIYALAVFDDGAGGGPALYAAGRFTHIGPIITPSIARWNGSTWSSLGGISALPTNTVPGDVYALCAYDDGNGPGLYAAGVFAGAGSVPVHGNIARWRSGAWSALGASLSLFPTGPVHALTVGDDGSGPALYAGGQSASSFGGAKAKSIARWGGAAWSAVGPGVTGPTAGSPGQVLALAAATDGRSIFAAGKFVHAGGVQSDGVAEWAGCACYADCDADGALTAADFGCFQAKFVAGDPWADCNQDAVLAVSDFTCFQNRLVGGCP